MKSEEPNGGSHGPDDTSETSRPTVDHTEFPSGLARRIGHYHIQRTIARGGMGTVYKAVQESPRRTVAIKVMRDGIASKSALRRFEFEAQLLGRLRHPGIAQIYEAGTHKEDAGEVPYFAMEYIPNAKPITEFAREKHLGTRERLALFAKVCNAVHHGHQKGIVHRDLKPTNILVGPSGEPKVIDFGVARATDSDLALTAMQTDIGQLIGTVQYMSPEQCEADPDDIDTRSDVYALGVTLYELLCDRLPYRIERKPVYEATRIIRESSPDRPSTINNTLRGDVETIVLKALEKERDRRYQSAADLGRDINAYLSGEAISARPASMTYQLRVFARRNKPAVIGALAVLLVSVVSAVLITRATFQAERTRLVAEQERLRADQADLRADEERRRADEHSRNLESTEELLSEVMASLNPIEIGDQVRAYELLDRYAEAIDNSFSGSPFVEANKRFEIASNYLLLTLMYPRETERAERLLDAATNQLEKVIQIYEQQDAESHPGHIQALRKYAQFLAYRRDLPRAEALRRRVVDICRETYGPEHEETLAACGQLASVLVKRNKLSEAEGIMRRVLDATETADQGNEPSGFHLQLASILRERGAFSEAETMCGRVVEYRRTVYGPNARGTVGATDTLASIYVAQGRLGDAAALYDERVDRNALGVTRWFDTEPELSNDAPRVIVFWETWCPYSHVFVPQLSERCRPYLDQGLEVFGLVSLSRNTNAHQAEEFIDHHELCFPSAICDNQLKRRHSRSGIPDCLVVDGDRLLWRGHPAGISKAFLDGLVGNARH